MASTRFPARPSEVVPLTAQEFGFELNTAEVPPLDAVCQRFGDDSNRAIVWLLRFRALKALCVRPEMTEWLGSRAHAWPSICQVAATFELNDDWEFDQRRFRSAVEALRPPRPGPTRR